MRDLVPKNELGLFADNKGIAKVDSMAVADAFGKEHRNVIRAIKELDCSEEFRLLNFEQSEFF